MDEHDGYSVRSSATPSRDISAHGAPRARLAGRVLARAIAAMHAARVGTAARMPGGEKPTGRA